MKITIAHLYPELLNLYGDRGNVIVLENRLKWRGIDCEVVEIKLGDDVNFGEYDVVFLGGGSDKEQEIVGQALMDVRNELQRYVEDNGVVLAVSSGFELLGEQGLGILDITTQRGDRRMVGNIAIQADFLDRPIVGFENHDGVTQINNLPPLGKVISGFGNNGVDGYEGVRFLNVFGTYLHGPLLPKNPHFCDYILDLVIKRKGSDFTLEPIDDELEWEANEFLVNMNG